MESKPHDLSEAVHAALSQWHNTEVARLPWSQMLVISQHQAEQPALDLPFVVKGVLLEALNALEHQSTEKATILRLRFLDLLTATATANRLNLTADVVHKRQRSAIEDLAAILGQMEMETRSARALRIQDRLESPELCRLFGADAKLTDLMQALTAVEGSSLVAVVGIGGIGKTTLADAAVRTLAMSPRYVDIAWVSARQQRFTPWAGLDDNVEGRPALTPERLLELVAQQLGVAQIAGLSQAEARTQLANRLKSRPYLVVIDNLETSADYQALLPELQRLANPSRFLLTSRRRLYEHPGVLNLDLDEISTSDSLALLRHEARERGIEAVANASDEALLRVHSVAGGNPLALKLLLGQMSCLPLSQVVDDLRDARGKTVDALYRFIYLRSWQLLDHGARQVLAVMPLLAESGGGLQQLAALCQLPREALTAALQHLIALSLVNVRGGVDVRRYSIHRLTATFLLNEVVKWQTTA